MPRRFDHSPAHASGQRRSRAASNPVLLLVAALCISGAASVPARADQPPMHHAMAPAAHAGAPHFALGAHHHADLT